MKKTLLAALAIAGLAYSNAGAAAANNGDLIIGFDATGGTGASKNLVVNIGSGWNASSLISSLNLNLASDLSSTYGSDWYSRTDLYWGVIAAVSPASNGDILNTLYASTTTGSSAWTRASSGTQGNIRASVQSLYAQINIDNVNAQGGSAAGSFIMDKAEGGSWGSLSDIYTSFGFGGSVESAITNGLDIYRIVPGSGDGVLKGTIAIDNSGVVSAVPEPSTYALLGFGALLLIVAYRRRNA